MPNAARMVTGVAETLMSTENLPAPVRSPRNLSGAETSIFPLDEASVSSRYPSGSPGGNKRQRSLWIADGCSSRNTGKQCYGNYSADERNIWHSVPLFDAKQE